MENAKISSWQLFCLMVLFELGTAVIFNLGMQAQQDTWISVLLGMAGGLLLFPVYGFLHRQFPDQPLTGYVQQILGKFVGWPLSLLYVVYFLYIAARDLNDMVLLIRSAWMDQTPFFVQMGTIVLAICYVLHHGIKVLAKTGEFFYPIYLFSILLSFLLIVVAGLPDLQNLQPIGEDWKLIFSSAFPVNYTFPFGEMIVFTMLFPYLNQPGKAIQTGLKAMLVSGLIISLTILIEIAVLDVNVVIRSPLPFLVALGKVEIGQFVQRVDVLAVFILVVGNFFKISLYLYSAVMGTAGLFRIEKQHQLVYPIGSVLLFLTSAISSNPPEHAKEGLYLIPWILHLPMQTGIPLLLLGIAFIKKRGKKFASTPSSV